MTAMAMPLNEGCALVLQRSVALQDLSAFAHLSQLNDERVRDCLDRWQAQGENFLLYSVSSTGIHSTFETSRVAHLVERIGLFFGQARARQAVCKLHVHTQEDMRDVLGQMAQQHEAHVLQEHGLARTAADESARLVLYPGEGTRKQLLVLHVPAKTLQHRDINGCLQIMDSLLATKQAVQENWMRLRIDFERSDAEAEPDHNCPEVRAFLLALMEAAPWWLALVHPAEYVKWFGCLLAPRLEVKGDESKSYRFNADSIRRVAAIPELEATHMLDCSECQPHEARAPLEEGLRLMVANLVAGFDLIRLDEQRQSAKRLGLRSA